MESVRKEHYNIIEWRNRKGNLHRLDGPAIEYLDGSKEWWVNGNFHREDGPAIEYPNGTKVWCINGKLHREDGPAREWIGGKVYYLNDIRYSEEEFHKEIIKLKLNRIKEL